MMINNVILTKIETANQAALKSSMALHHLSQRKARRNSWMELKHQSQQTRGKLLHHHLK